MITPLASTDHPPLPGEGEMFTVEHYPDRDSWLAAKTPTGIGGSSAASLWATEIASAGQKSYGSPMSLYAWHTGTPEMTREESEDMEVGALLEDDIATLYERRTGDRVVYPGPFTFLRSLSHPYMVVSLDGAVDRLGASTWAALECKDCNGRREAELWDDGMLPLRVQAQLQHAAFVTGWSYGVAAALVFHRFRALDLPRDETFIAAHLERCAEMWTRIQQREPPPADGHPATAEALARMFPQEDGATVTLDSSLAAWAQIREEASETIRRQEVIRDEASNKLRLAIGSAEIGELPDGTRFSLKTVHKDAYTVREQTYRELRKMKGKAKP